MQEVAAETLPPEAKLGYSGQTQQFLETSGGVAVTFGLALLIVFLVLAAQFESFIHPLIIMLSVPLAVSGALLSLWLTGNSLNVYSQIGIILLIGLMAKNGILIVEFANQLRDEGRSIRDAVLEASVLRLRPIVMTVVSTMLGAVPLVLATGAGAESRAAIGIVIIGGLGIASLLTLFVTPVLYDLLARFTRPPFAAPALPCLACADGVAGILVVATRIGARAVDLPEQDVYAWSRARVDLAAHRRCAELKVCSLLRTLVAGAHSAGASVARRRPMHRPGPSWPRARSFGATAP